MALPCSTPRHLAPTVGLPLVDGECVASGLVLTFGAFDCVVDNAACFAGNTFPANGSIMHFEDIRLYVATVAEVFPSVVTSILDVPLSRLAHGPNAANGCVEFMVVNACENNRPLQERRAGGESSALEQEQDPLTASIQHLCAPVIVEVDPTAAVAALEATRQKLLEEATKVAANQRRLNATVHEYNTAHGFVRQVQHRGRDLASELDRVADSHAGVAQPVYSTPTKNMRAAKAAAAKLKHLEGEELCRQPDRV